VARPRAIKRRTCRLRGVRRERESPRASKTSPDTRFTPDSDILSTPLRHHTGALKPGCHGGGEGFRPDAVLEENTIAPASTAASALSSSQRELNAITGTHGDSRTRRMNWRTSASLESPTTRPAVASASLAAGGGVVTVISSGQPVVQG